MHKLVLEIFLHRLCISRVSVPACGLFLCFFQMMICWCYLACRPNFPRWDRKCLSWIHMRWSCFVTVRTVFVLKWWNNATDELYCEIRPQCPHVSRLQRQDGLMQRSIREVNTSSRWCVLWDLDEDTHYSVQVRRFLGFLSCLQTNQTFLI